MVRGVHCAARLLLVDDLGAERCRALAVASEGELEALLDLLRLLMIARHEVLDELQLLLISLQPLGLADGGRGGVPAKGSVRVGGGG